MDNSKLKSYAIQARRDCIQAVTDRAAKYGLTTKNIEPITEKGDVALIGGQAFPRSIVDKRKALEERIIRQGFQQTMEAMAYTWFNRLVAIRYMELQGYLEHGYRVLSHPEGKNTPEILEHAEHLDLPGLDKSTVIDLKLDGTKENELYQMLLIAQCNALHRAMPFLFEHVDDETELLLPDNLLHSDSLIRKLVNEIPEEDWQEVEIIGWLYQFYISEKKDQVIGKVVKSEDIPAATQLFTPNWIVKYLVQNTLGRQWMATYPNSPLKTKMEYYIEPAEQKTEVQAQLNAITPANLNPEEMTLLDPACGSGHILVEAYELLKAIYQERGYRAKDIPRLILEKNLFGLEIDERAEQLAAFALLMKARSDDLSIFTSKIHPQVLAIQESKGLDAKEITEALNAPILKEKLPPPETLYEETEKEITPLFNKDTLSVAGNIKQEDVAQLIALFEYGKTFGSLIRVPEPLAENLPLIAERVNDVFAHGGMFEKSAAKLFGPIVEQARLLARNYDAVVVNPPYMGSKHMNPLVKKFATDHFSEAKSDLFACFIERSSTLANSPGHSALVTMQSWMFLSSFEKMRERILREKTIGTMAHLGARAFGSISGEIVQTTMFVLKNQSQHAYKPVFFRLLDGGEVEKRTALANNEKRFDITAQDEFRKIPGSPLAYWVSAALFKIFVSGTSVGQFANVKRGMTTSNNALFLRYWPEVSILKSYRYASNQEEALDSRAKWFPYSKGGGCRKWYGFLEYFVNWEDSGRDVIAYAKTINASFTRTIVNIPYYFKPSVGFPYITSGMFTMRSIPVGCIYDSGGPGVFSTEEKRKFILGCMNSSPADVVLKVLNPTLNLQIADVVRLPLPDYEAVRGNRFLVEGIPRLVTFSRQDWDSFETSWDFQSLPILTASSELTATLESSYTTWITHNRDTIAEMKRLEEENNRLFIDAYGLAGEFTPDVPIEQITLTVNPAYRYGGKLTEEEQWTRFCEDTMQELISYAIGCMMGRYSLDKPGLIYAHSGNQGFDPTQYQIFPADEDGIIPITDYPWFKDDAANRLEAFIATAWPKEHLEENLSFIAKSLGANRNEQARDTVRRYFSGSFFKDHLQTYKKRPIYWLFSSGKQRAFQCLVYLHRYHEGTLSRMRTEYVIPFLGKIAARMDHLDSDIFKATSTSHLKKLEKERDLLRKHQTELQAFDEQLRHYADQRISLDLDDGVKVNYGKFGNLLAEVKAVTGGSEDE